MPKSGWLYKEMNFILVIILEADCFLDQRGRKRKLNTDNSRSGWYIDSPSGGEQIALWGEHLLRVKDPIIKHEATQGLLGQAGFTLTYFHDSLKVPQELA